MYLKISLLLVAFFLMHCGTPPMTKDSRSISGKSKGGSGDSKQKNGGSSADDGGSDSDDGSASGHKGSVIKVSALGLVDGWAVNQADLSQAVFVFFFADGNSKSGKDLGSATANLAGFDGNNQGDHRFNFMIPEEYRDGASHKIAAYMEVESGEEEIKDGAKSFTAFVASAAARDFYDNNLINQFQGNCTTCHSASEVAFDNHFSLLLDPPPSEGGTSTTNRLYLKASGQLNHGGGNRCTGAGNQPCSDIAQWWNTALGN